MQKVKTVPVSLKTLILQASLLLMILMSWPVSASDKVVLEYFGEMGCGHCDTFIEKTVPLLEKKYGISMIVNSHDILDPEVYERCEKMLSERGYVFSFFPVVIIGNNIYQGETEINAFLEKELEYYAENKTYSREREMSAAENSDAGFSPESLSVVFASGLADGINPCAFTVLLFFFSYLTLRRKRYSDFIASGVIFILAVFISYLLIGFGLYSLLSAFTDIALFRLVMKIIASGATLVFAFASLMDFQSIKGKRDGKVILKMPDILNRRAHSAVREGFKKGMMPAAVFLTGVSVSVTELACTGQIYLPSIVYMLQKGDSGIGLVLLLIYNTGFVLPVIILFLLLAKGIRTERISVFFRTHVHVSKAILSFLFIFLTFAIWIL